MGGARRGGFKGESSLVYRASTEPGFRAADRDHLRRRGEDTLEPCGWTEPVAITQPAPSRNRSPGKLSDLCHTRRKDGNLVCSPPRLGFLPSCWVDVNRGEVKRSRWLKGLGNTGLQVLHRCLSWKTSQSLQCLHRGILMQHVSDLFDHRPPFFVKYALGKSYHVQSFTEIEHRRQVRREKVMA